MREITYAEAVREALSEAMREDEAVFMLGEDIGVYGGAFGVSRGMVEEFGEERIRSTQFLNQQLQVRQLAQL